MPETKGTNAYEGYFNVTYWSRNGNDVNIEMYGTGFGENPFLIPDVLFDWKYSLLYIFDDKKESIPSLVIILESISVDVNNCFEFSGKFLAAKKTFRMGKNYILLTCFDTEIKEGNEDG